MTILSNHRIHSYKATVGRAYRDVSPKKMPQQKAWKKTQAKALSKLFTPISIPESVPEPSAPSAVMTTRTIYVWGIEYTVEIPQDFDIYEGLRLWYPELYRAVVEEENNLAELRAMEEGLTEEAVDNAWAHQDYLEWLCD